MEKFYPTQNELNIQAQLLADDIWHIHGEGAPLCPPVKVYPIPRGGVPTAYLVKSMMRKELNLVIVDNESEADIFIDDLIDSGGTLARYTEGNDKPFYALYDKRKENLGWIVFPWEETDEGSAEDIIIRQLQYIGEDPTREGLKGTPDRIIRMYDEIYRGYDKEKKPKETCFPNGKDGLSCDEMIIDTGYFFSTCEHHMVPFFGNYWFAYIPGSRIIGLSKVADWIDYKSAKLQIQERLVKEVLDEMQRILVNPVGLALVMEGRHLCKEMRDVKKYKGAMITSDLRGAFKDKPETRAEFMRFVKTGQ